LSETFQSFDWILIFFKYLEKIFIKRSWSWKMKPPELTDLLEQLKKEGKYVEVRVCPRCKSTRIKRVGSMQGDMSGHMAITLPKFECLDCGWRGRLTIYATNRPLNEKQIEAAAEAFEEDSKKKRNTAD
jgi:hypothetical protein